MIAQKKRCDECMFSVGLPKDSNHIKCTRYASGCIKNNADWCNDFLGMTKKEDVINKKGLN